MKKIYNKIDKKTFITIIILIAMNTLVFFISKLLIRNPKLIGCNLDNSIPFLPGFIYIYILWYIALVIIPYYVSQKSKTSFAKYVVTYIISLLICGIIFVVYPNTIKRATIEGTGITKTLVKIIYFLDTPVNCLPSIHCLYSYLFIFAIFDTKKSTSIYLKILVTIFSIAVVFATLFVKQHVIYDSIAALIVASIIWIVVDKFKLYKSVLNIYQIKAKDEG